MKIYKFQYQNTHIEITALNLNDNMTSLTFHEFFVPKSTLTNCYHHDPRVSINYRKIILFLIKKNKVAYFLPVCKVKCDNINTSMGNPVGILRLQHSAVFSMRK